MRQLGAEIVVATSNEGKVKELAPLFMQKNIAVKSLRHFPEIPAVVEDGHTFADNAFIKARTVALALGVPAVADDSGLCVDLLDGQPGVYSARYAGEHATDGQNNTKLLEALRSASRLAGEAQEHKPVSLSGARFVCAICLVDAFGNKIAESHGECEGIIIAEPRGSHGFGYDPLFYLPAYGQTMAELSVEHKNTISHRGRAIQSLWLALANS
ncbi:XTP/dITP diphosphatase [Paenibacillus sp. S3N08]|uniref:dITP/XTP pyrophosphatase n=1 Tax=Paenibacillus agricola TaxID=2716264 RepID=A0ABX0J1X8_9BACL|nr:XTP/dITP diphosphatase [Paenibacillus agricola]